MWVLLELHHEQCGSLTEVERLEAVSQDCTDGLLQIRKSCVGKVTVTPMTVTRTVFTKWSLLCLKSNEVCTAEWHREA